MKIKTSELSGAALDWAVAKAEGWIKGDITTPKWCRLWRDEIRTPPLYPSANWSQGGPIIEREEIGIKRHAPSFRGQEWEACGSITAKGAGYAWAYGPSPLIAAMRCYVASKLGDEVEIPGELL